MDKATITTIVIATVCALVVVGLLTRGKLPAFVTNVKKTA